MEGRAADWREKPGHALAVVLGAAALCWPALWCGYPFLNVDCITYLASGRRVILLLLGRPYSTDYLRSEIYCAGIYLLHWNKSAWPVIAFDALLTAWMLWLVVQALMPNRPLRGVSAERRPLRVYAERRPLRVYAGLVAVLCVFTTASWCVSELLPDSLGVVLYLGLYLLVFARETLRPWETVTVSAVVCWAVTTHPTYMPIALGLCACLALCACLRWRPMHGRGRRLLQATAILLLGLCAEVGVNDRIFGRPFIISPHPPYLMARIVADGPSHDYLREHCPTLRWVLCDSVDKLPWSDDDFLWAPHGVYASATPEQRAELSKEEMPLVLGTLREYPLRQARVSLRNFTAQLTHFAIDPAGYDNPWMVSMFDLVIPGSKAKYLRTQSREKALHRLLFAAVQRIVVDLSVVAALLLLPWTWRLRDGPDRSRLLGLSLVVIYVLLANAAVTGMLSGVYARYQGRVVWLLPMLVCLLLARWRAAAS
jgi:hypothetical protein